MNKRSLGLAVLALAAGLGAISSAHATWTFSSSGTSDSNGNALAKTTYNPDAGFSGAPSLTIGGVYGANGGTCSGTPGTSNAVCSPNGFGSGAAWTSQALTFYSGGGLGMSSDGYTTPNHALDNGPATNRFSNQTGVGNTEGVLLSFSSSVVLSSIGIGYVSGDADISVFRYTGATAPTLPGGSVSSFLTDALGSTNSGWDLVGNYGNLGTDTSNPYNLVNTGSVGSSWWLITAYNSSYGSTSANGKSLNQGDDYFKLYAVAGNACTGGGTQCGGTSTGGGSVPEPGSIALVCAALLGTWASRRHVGGVRTAAA